MSYRHVQPLIREGRRFHHQRPATNEGTWSLRLVGGGSHLCRCWCSSLVSRMFTETSARYRSRRSRPRRSGHGDRGRSVRDRCNHPARRTIRLRSCHPCCLGTGAIPGSRRACLSALTPGSGNPAGFVVSGKRVPRRFGRRYGADPRCFGAEKEVMSVKLVPAGGPRLTPLVDLVVLAAAVVLLLAGAALILNVLAASIAILVITIGVALVAIAGPTTATTTVKHIELPSREPVSTAWQKGTVRVMITAGDERALAPAITTERGLRHVGRSEVARRHTRHRLVGNDQLRALGDHRGRPRAAK